MMLNSNYQGSRPRCSFRQEEFKSFPKLTYKKLAPSPEGLVFQPIKLIYTTLVEGHHRLSVPIYFEITPVVFDKKIFIFVLFGVVVMATKILHGIKIFGHL